MKRLAGVMLMWTLGTGCYTMQPVSGTPLPEGTMVGLDINDAGRLALGGTMGPSIERIDGRLVGRDATEYVVAVSQIHLLRGGEQIWSGERIRIKTEYVTGVSERRFSRGRTALVTGAVLGVLVVAFNQSLAGIIGGDEGKKEPPPVDLIRVLRP